MNDSHSDALVFFGATGDLAYKKIFPALQAMVKRGHLNVPVIGVAKAGWNLDQFRARRATASRNTAASIRRLSTSCAACCAMSTATTTTRRPSQRSRKELGAAQRPAHYLAIPPVLFGLVVEQLAKSGCADGRAGHRRKAVRARPRLGAGAQPDPARRLSTRRPSSASTTTWASGRCTTWCSSASPTVPGAVLEPQPCRERADHHGGGLRRPGPRRVLRSDRHHPRRGPESSVPGAGQPGDGAAGPDRQRIDSRREGESAEGDSAARSEGSSCAGSSAATATRRAWRRTRRWRPSRR